MLQASGDGEGLEADSLKDLCVVVTLLDCNSDVNVNSAKFC
jgi:hypothetical protein